MPLKVLKVPLKNAQAVQTAANISAPATLLYPRHQWPQKYACE